MMNTNRGSKWRIWDLHVHTPSSYDYEDKSVTNEDIVKSLAEAHVSVVAITDHYMIDVQRINELKKIGASYNISILPGIEFCSELGGSDSVHFIGIFSETANIESIWTKIQGVCNLTENDIETKGGYDRVCCEFVKTCDLIVSLGGIITIHAGKKSNSIEGIKNNLLVKQELKQNLLSKYKPLLDVGKTDDVENYRKHVFPDIKFSLPVILCSDNHDIKKYNVKEKMWIKADPTFEGLKQILFEPDERVRIQSFKPDDKNIYQVIDRIELKEDGFWNETIFLNPNLNTIIGGRSTGKSTLLKAIAAKHECREVEPNDFVRKHLNGVSIKWKDGTDQLGREIDYFRQSYMHDIAFDSSKTNELVEGIIRNKDTSGELQNYYQCVIDTQKNISEYLFSLFQIQKDLYEKKNELIGLGKREGVLQQVEILKSKIVELQKDSSITNDVQVEFESQIAQLKEYDIKISQADCDLNLFKTLKLVTPFDNTFEERYKISSLLFGLNQSEFAREYNNIKLKTEANFGELIDKFITDTEKAKEGIIKLQEEIKNSELYKKGKSYIEGNKELKDISSKLVEEEKKLHDIRQCQSQYEELENKKSSLLNLIVQKHCALKTMAEEVVKKLQISYDGLVINVVLNHHNDSLQQFLESRLNQRGTDRQDYLLKFVRNYDSDNENYIKDILNKLLNEELQLKNGYIAQNVATELIAKSWYSLDYELSYQNDSFKQMSEGKQAFVILKLLLDFSDKKCPILIDQPEDSLDNRAIYNELVKYIKKKKINRQIILVTHNSNVVVSADAENVIVANQEGTDSHNKSGLRFQYVNGALEDTRIKDPKETIILNSQGIREHICDILEGGRDAFEKRELKYGFRR